MCMYIYYSIFIAFMSLICHVLLFHRSVEIVNTGYINYYGPMTWNFSQVLLGKYTRQMITEKHDSYMFDNVYRQIFRFIQEFFYICIYMT